MATTTERLGLTCPEGTEAGDVAVINGNMEILDEIVPIVVYSSAQPSSPKEGTVWLKPIS